MGETCEPSVGLAKGVSLGSKNLQEPCQVPRAQELLEWPGVLQCCDGIPLCSVKFKAKVRGQREKGNLSYVLFKPFCKRFSFEMGPHQQHSLTASPLILNFSGWCTAPINPETNSKNVFVSKPTLKTLGKGNKYSRKERELTGFG